MDFIVRSDFASDNRKKEKFYEQRRAILNEIPEMSGCYILTFPNGKKYLGGTTNLYQRILFHFKNLFPTKLTMDRRKRNCDPVYRYKWYQKVREENPDLKDFKGIEIQIAVSDDYKYLLNYLKEKIPPEEKHLYY